MIRDKEGRTGSHNGTLGEVTEFDMHRRGYNKVNNIWIHKDRPDDMLSHEAALHWYAIRADNFNDGFDAGLEWVKDRSKYVSDKEQLLDEIEQELQMG